MIQLTPLRTVTNYDRTNKSQGDDFTVETKKAAQIKEHDSKIGTWISLGVVAAGILVTYFVLYGLYMARV